MTVRFFFLTLIVWPCSIASAESPSGGPIPSETIKAWGEQSKEVATARIEGDLFRAISLGSMTCEDFEKRLDALAADASPSQLSAMYDALAGGDGAVIGPLETSFVFVTDGRSTSERGWGDRSVRGEDADVDTVGQGYQATISEAGTSSTYTLGLGDFRYVPGGEVLKEFAEEPSGREGLRTFVRHATSFGTTNKLVVREVDGAVVRVATRRDDGTWEKVTRQEAFTTDANGIAYPRLIARYECVAGRAANVHVTLIEKAEFNTQVDASEFQVSAPEGTLVVDTRVGPSGGDASKLTEDVASVTAYADDRITQAKAPTSAVSADIRKKKGTAGGGGWKGLMILANVAVVLSIVGFLSWRYVASRR